MRPHTVDQLREHARGRGGDLLSTVYIDCKRKLLWVCREGHQWESSWDGIKSNGSWCPACVGLVKPPLEQLQSHAAAKGGLLLSTDYLNNRTKMTWQCDKGHQWESAWANVQSGNWCAICAGRSKPPLSELHEHAAARGGVLQSTVYKSNKHKLLWVCREGHQWEARWHDVKHRDTWCPICSGFKNERVCRAVLETYLGFTLPKTRFTYNHKKYEWDGYNSECNVAFEYHGEQHYKKHKFFHKSSGDFAAQQERDEEKLEYAKKNGITVLVIPFDELHHLTG